MIDLQRNARYWRGSEMRPSPSKCPPSSFSTMSSAPKLRIVTNQCSEDNVVSLDNRKCLERIHGAIVMKIIHGGLAWLHGALIRVVHAECVAHSINQASFKPAGLVTGDPITGEKSHSRHSPLYVPCTNALWQPSNYPIPGPDPHGLQGPLASSQSPSLHFH